jgi:hypothetical protein
LNLVRFLEVPRITSDSGSQRLFWASYDADARWIRRLVSYTEATGCNLCRHCPVVPIYEGQFRIVQADVVAGDIEAQVAAGAQHITFGTSR